MQSRIVICTYAASTQWHVLLSLYRVSCKRIFTEFSLNSNLESNFLIETSALLVVTCALLVVTGALLVVTGALLVVTRSY